MKKRVQYSGIMMGCIMGGLLSALPLFAQEIIDCPSGYICFTSQSGDIQAYLEENGSIDTEYFRLIEGLSGFNLTGSQNNTTTILPSISGSDSIITEEFIPTGSADVNGINELEKAIHWGYNNKITMYDNEETFNTEYAVLREDASKLLYQAAHTVGYTAEHFTECTFNDIDNVSESLQLNIAHICQAGGLMKGDAGKFFPTRRLTKAEAITVIARIVGIQDTTTTSTWWAPYRNYVQQLHITDGLLINEETMDDAISRGDLIILLYRLGKLYDKYFGELSIALNNPANLPTDTSNSDISVGAGIIDTPRFTNALLRMYDNNMTVFSDASDYKPYDILTKEQAAKLLSIYRSKFSPDVNATVICAISDINTSELKSYIEDLCKYGAIPNTTQYNPNAVMNKSDFIRILLTMQSLIDTNTDQQTVIEKAIETELISAKDLSTFGKPITRYEAALILHTQYLKNMFISNLNNAGSLYYVISAIENTNPSTGDNTVQQSYIDIMTIDSKDFNNGYINLFNKVYKLHKKETVNYFPTSYLWYGEIGDINTDNIVGTISLAISQKSGAKIVVEGYLNLNNNSNIYTIEPASTIPYYIITKIK